MIISYRQIYGSKYLVAPNSCLKAFISVYWLSWKENLLVLLVVLNEHQVEEDWEMYCM